MDLKIAFSEQIQTLNLNGAICLRFRNTNSLVLNFNDIMIIWKLCFKNPFLFERIWISRACSPKSDVLVLNFVNITENDNSSISISFTYVSQWNDKFLWISIHILPVWILNDLCLNVFYSLTDFLLIKKSFNKLSTLYLFVYLILSIFHCGV